MGSSGDIGAEVATAIQQFDTELGRPPFPSTAPPTLLQRAEAIHIALIHVVNANKLSVLQHMEEVTQTLPVLCASLPAGSGGTPSLPLYRSLLDSLSLVATYASFPIPQILAVADALLSSDDVSVFRLAAASGAMTPERLAEALHVTLPTPSSGKKKKTPKAKEEDSGNTKQPHRIAPELLREVLATSLNEECRAVVLLLFDKTTTFSALVGEDGSLASAILDVYGDYMLPRLKPLALLDCLDVSLLDHFIDLLQHHHVFALHFLDDRKAIDAMAEKWQASQRVEELCKEAGRRRVTAADAFGSLVNAALLALVVTSEKCTFSSAAGKRTCLEFLWAALGKAFLVLVNEKGSELVVMKDEAGNLIITTTLARVVKPIQLVVSCSECALLRTDVQPEVAETLASLYQQMEAHLLQLIQHCVAKSPKATQPPKPQQQTRTSQKSAESSKGKKNAAKSKKAAVNGATNVKSKPTTTQSKQQSSAAPEEVAHTHSSKDNAADENDGTHEKLPFSSAILFFCRCLLFTEIVRFEKVRRTEDAPAALLALVSLLRYHETHQCTKLGNAVSSAFFDLVGYLTRYGCDKTKMYLLARVLCTATSDSADAREERDSPARTIADLTLTSGSFLWACPLLVFAAESEHGHTPVAEGMAFAVLHAGFVLQNDGVSVVEKETVSDEATEVSSPSSFRALLFSGNAALCLGLFCALLNENVLEKFAASITDLSVAPLQPYVSFLLQRLCIPPDVHANHHGDDEDRKQKDKALLERAASGLQKMQAVAAARVASLSEAEKKLVAEREKVYQVQLQKQLQEANRLQQEQREFEARTDKIRKSKEDAQARIHAEFMSRKEFGARQKQLEKEQRENLREIAMRKINRDKEINRQVQAAESAQRLNAYKEKMASTFRVTQFLESVNVPTGRILEIRAALQSVLTTITPDELLEYVVTGVAEVPKDMLGDEDEDDNNNNSDNYNTGAEGGGKEAERGKGSKPTFSFWDEVMNSRPRPLPEAEKAEKRLSFHARIRPFMDLFCYEGGDEFGNVPAVLPFLRLSMVKRVTPLSIVRQFHFSTVLEVFQVLQKHHLVVLSSDGIAQLTVLGYRYHFPYHDPEAMLEVRVLRGKERIREALLESAIKESEEVSESVSGSCYGDGEEGEEDDEASDWDDKRILPELEFGI